MRAGFRSLLADTHFSEILTGSMYSMVATVVAIVLGMVASIIVVRFYGAEMMGVLAVVNSFIMLATILSGMGMNVTLLRLIPEHVHKYSYTSAFRVYRTSLLSVAVASVLLGGLLFVGSDAVATHVFSKPRLSFFIALASGAIVFYALMDLSIHTLRGLRLIRSFVIIKVLPTAVMVLILLAMTGLMSEPNSPVYAQLVSWGVAGIVGSGAVAHAFRHRKRVGDVVHTIHLKKIWSISIPMLMTASMIFIIGQIGVIMLAVFRTEREVGYYAVAVRVATLSAFVIQAINTMAAPKFSELFHDGKMADLFRVAKQSTRLIFWSTVPILLALIVFGKPLLRVLFGEELVVAYGAMVILLWGQFVNAISGSTGYFMNMTGHHVALRNIVAVSAVATVVLSYVMIPTYGISGAAVAGTVGLVLWNGYTLLYIKLRYGHTIGYVPFVRPFRRG